MMSDINFGVGSIFLMQTGVGTMGNSLLFCLYTYNLLTGQKMRPTDLILNQLVFVNNLLLFFRGIPQIMAAFGWKSFMGDAECQLVIYIHRVARGVSLYTTCLLSAFQATKLGSTLSWFNQLIIRCPRCIGFCCLYIWILQLLVNIEILRRVTGPRDSKNLSMNMNYKFCSSLIPEKYVVVLNSVLFFVMDFLCLMFIIWACSSIINFLYKHKQQVHYIHSQCIYPRTIPEDRATCTVLILVTTFAFFLCLSSISTFCRSFIRDPNQWLVDATVFLGACFPAFSPFLLIITDRHVFYICNFYRRN
eukprot:NP_001008921.1 vomeronasal 1 receptor 25 [Rattus norvegicus]